LSAAADEAAVAAAVAEAAADALMSRRKQRKRSLDPTAAEPTSANAAATTATVATAVAHPHGGGRSERGGDDGDDGGHKRARLSALPQCDPPRPSLADGDRAAQGEMATPTPPAAPARSPLLGSPTAAITSLSLLPPPTALPLVATSGAELSNFSATVLSVGAGTAAATWLLEGLGDGFAGSPEALTLACQLGADVLSAHGGDVLGAMRSVLLSHASAQLLATQRADADAARLCAMREETSALRVQLAAVFAERDGALAALGASRAALMSESGRAASEPAGSQECMRA
jgi:hypothetical protein